MLQYYDEFKRQFRKNITKEKVICCIINENSLSKRIELQLFNNSLRFGIKKPDSFLFCQAMVV
jgi:hypothetical protein